MTISWEPSSAEIDKARMTAFRRRAEEVSGQALPDYDALYRWSIEHPEAFWSLMWDEAPVISERKGETLLVDGDKMPGAKWFPDARLNFAENLLRYPDERDAIVFSGEGRVSKRLTRRALYEEVSKAVKTLERLGVGEGDRVAAYMPNLPETVILMLATASVGGIFSSCSPDFGVDGVVDRFQQIEPKLFVAADGVFYNGKTFNNLDKIEAIRARISSIENIVVIPYTQSIETLKHASHLLWPELLSGETAGEIAFRRLPFDHPLYIMFSSGTTGVPKCIVHGAGGTLLQHMKEHLLHCDVRPADRVFYFTTCGWMMWNWLVSALASEAALMLYDGSPFYPDGDVLWHYAEQERFTLFGTSAKYIDALKKEGGDPGNAHNLSALRMICSTGSPLSPESFDYVYEHIKRDLCLASISGGTDIVSCFALGNPVLPVYRGALQCRGLGMAVEVFDENGTSVVGKKGELVCTRPFPSMPIGFWNDVDGGKYQNAYFARYPNLWHHGDYVELTETGGMVFFGRSDAVLNPGGVRIGTAEIYRQVETLDEVIESVVVGQNWQGDLRLVLFVRLRDGVEFDDDLAMRIRQRIRANTTARHVPQVVLPVADIPRTKSGKIVELAVREVIHGRPVDNIEALANPEALDQFRNRPELSL